MQNKLELFEKCLETLQPGVSDFHNWLLNNSPNIPFDIGSDYYYSDVVTNEKVRVLNEIYDIWISSGCRWMYYWFSNNGKIGSDEGGIMTPENCVRINKTKIRDYKIEHILS